MRFHASCAARPGLGGFDAVLLLGPAGCGKSDFLLRLIHAGWALVADDQVLVEDGLARAPEILAGMIEVRGLGLFRMDYQAAAPLRLVARLGAGAVRLPAPRRHPALGLAEVDIDPAMASAVARAGLALDAAIGAADHVVGAFAA